jgi:hypothetical protein
MVLPKLLVIVIPLFRSGIQRHNVANHDVPGSRVFEFNILQRHLLDEIPVTLLVNLIREL